MRYRLLDTLRQYGREKLADSGEADDVQRRHAEHYARASWAAWNLDHFRSMAAFDQRWAALEMDNLRAAIAWAERGDDALFARLVAGSFLGLSVLSLDLREQARLLSAALARNPGDQKVRAHLEQQAGTTAVLQGEEEEGVRLMNSAAARYEQLGEARWAADVIGSLLEVRLMQGHEDLLAEMHERRCGLLRSAAAWPQLADALRHRALMMAVQERPEAARALCEEAAVVARANGLAPGREVPWVLLAEGRADEELELAREDARRRVFVLSALNALRRVAISEAALGRVRRALRLHGCVMGRASSAGVRLFVGSLETRHIQAALEAAGPEAEALMAQGSRMSAEQLLDYALSDREDP